MYATHRLALRVGIAGLYQLVVVADVAQPQKYNRWNLQGEHHLAYRVDSSLRLSQAFEADAGVLIEVAADEAGRLVGRHQRIDHTSCRAHDDSRQQ